MKKLLGLLGLTVVFLLPLNVKAADEFSYNITCDKNAVSSLTEKINCNLYLVPEDTTALAGNIINSGSFSTELNLENIEDFTITSYDTSKFSITSGTENPKISFSIPNAISYEDDADIQLLTFTVKIAGNDQSCGTINYEGGDVTINIPSTETSVENPTNGAFAPYAVLAVAIVSAFGIFSIVKKNQKMYKL